MSSRKDCPKGCGRKCDIYAEQCVSCRYPTVAVKGAAPLTPEAQITEDREKAQQRERYAALDRKYQEALKTVERQEAELGYLATLHQDRDTTVRIEPREGSGTSEATPVIVASDWHCEEIVTSAQTNGLNEFNLEIADRRITRFWQSSLNLIKNHLNPGVTIHNVVVGLLGDFITNDIHEELVENVALGPIPATLWVQDRIIAGIDFLLNNSPYHYTFVCRVGNHSRTTKKTHFSQENRHSLEHFMYVNIAKLYRDEPRVSFVIQDGYHAYVDVYGETIRFHHGHAINYQGGIGGIFIPAFKAISQWDKARTASVDVFGHFHQQKDGGKFLSNGSLIGYNSFSVRIKADYEIPRQTLFMIDKKRSRTCCWPILLEK